VLCAFPPFTPSFSFSFSFFSFFCFPPPPPSTTPIPPFPFSSSSRSSSIFSADLFIPSKTISSAETLQKGRNESTTKKKRRRRRRRRRRGRRGRDRGNFQDLPLSPSQSLSHAYVIKKKAICINS